MYLQSVPIIKINISIMKNKTMTKLYQLLSLLLLVVTLTSCNFTENIDVHPDGSGNFSIEMDGAGLMAMAGEKLGNELGMKNNAKAIDSTFSFKEIFAAKKDSIAKLGPEHEEALK